MSNSSTLSSLAMLKVNADTAGTDYLDYLVPFVTLIFEKHPLEQVTNANVRNFLVSDFGLRVIDEVCESVLRRLYKRGVLELQNRTYRVKKLPKTQDIKNRKLRADAGLQQLLYAMVQYAKSKFSLEWSEDDSREALTRYLMRFSLESLRYYKLFSAMPNIAPPSDKDNFVISSFVRDLQQNKNPLLDAFIIYVKGNMLANALICPDLENIREKFDKTTFYLDTPMVVTVLGLHGPDLRIAGLELVRLIKKLDGRVAIFRHTLDELGRVLRGCELHINDPNARGRIIQEMRRDNRSPSDLALIRGSLEQLIADVSVELHSTPSYDGKFQIDETALEEVLDTEIKYYNPEAALFDVNSIRSVYVLRRGREPRKLEDCGAVLVTTNSALARKAFEYGKSTESSREVSPVITNFSLANLAWLKNPVDSPDIPRLELMAVCFAAMEPSEDLWSKYLLEVDKLKNEGSVSPDLHAFLRHSLRAREELMNLTLGSEEDFSERTMGQILERVKSDWIKEHQADIELERNAKCSAEARAKIAEETIAGYHESIDDYAHRKARSFAKWLYLAIFAIIVATSIAAMVLSLTTLVLPAWMSIILRILCAVGVFFGAINLIHGASGKSLAIRFEEWKFQSIRKDLVKSQANQHELHS